MTPLSPRQRWCVGAITVGIPLSAWHASYPANTWLQVGPIALALIAGVAALRRWPLSDRSIFCVTGFLLLHLVAARWTYSDVPYRAWIAAGSGWDIDAAFGFRRNMFDRLVHFAFGLLAVRPLIEVGTRHGGQSRRMAIMLAFGAMLAVSALYEIFEWLLAVFMDPAAAEAYNGQQGDVFDAPKDMAMATLGALVWLGATRGRSGWDWAARPLTRSD